MRAAFVFPGQGSQHVGMGKDLYDNFDKVKGLYDEASEAIGYDVAALSFSGPSEELNKTFRTQPCLLVASMASYVVLALKGIMPSVVTGHSLGEYSALTVAESMSFKDAVKITEIRGRIMQEATPEGMGLMAAILGCDRKIVDEICANSGISVANYNCPGQIVVSGDKAAVKGAMNMAKEAGAKRVVPLAVSVPSHSDLMEDAGKEFEKALKEIVLKDAAISFINNTEAKFISKAEEIRKSLIRQMSQPVLWEDCIKTVAQAGVNTLIEVGPGKVLSGLIKRIEPSARIFNVENTETLNKTLSNLK